MALVIALLPLTGLIPIQPVQVAYAATSQTVLVTVVPDFVGPDPPTGLTLTHVNDLNIKIDWTKDIAGAPRPGGDHSAVFTEIRVKLGANPAADRSDGHVVYYGDLETVDDIDTDITVGVEMPHYGAFTRIIWYDAADAVISDTWDGVGIYEEANFMSLSWIFGILLLVAAGLTVAMFVTRQMMLGWPSAIFWAIFGGHCYIQSTVTWDIEYLMFFAGIGMAIFCMFAMYGLRDKDLSGPDADDGSYIDEEREPDLRGNIEKDKEYGKEGKYIDEDTSPQVKAIRDRAKRRRQAIRKGGIR